MGSEHSLTIAAPYLLPFEKDRVLKIFPQRITKSIKLYGVAPLIADRPPLKVHQKAKSNHSAKLP